MINFNEYTLNYKNSKLVSINRYVIKIGSHKVYI